MLKYKYLYNNYYYLLYRIKGTKLYWVIDEGNDLEIYKDHVLKNNSINEVYYIYKIRILKHKNIYNYKRFDNFNLTRNHILIYSQ